MPADGKSGNKRKVRRGSAANSMIQATIEQQAQGPMSAAQIHRGLVAKFGSNTPGVKTVRDMVDEARSLGPAEPWTLADAEPDEIALVAPVWAVALENGYRLANTDMEWIVRILAAASDLPPSDALMMAALYRVEGRHSTRWLRDSLDALLAFAPWRDVACAERYFRAVNTGRIRPPYYTLGLVMAAIHGQVTADDVPHTMAYIANNPDEIIAVIKGDLLYLEDGPHPIRLGRVK